MSTFLKISNERVKGITRALAINARVLDGQPHSGPKDPI
jgi:hypothetical protein